MQGGRGGAGGPAVLVVEDDVLIAMGLEDALRDAGAATIDIAGSYDDARRQLANGDYALVVFDLNLDGISSVPLIEDWIGRGGQAVVASGYDDKSAVLDRLGVPVLPKPVPQEALSTILKEATR